MMPPKGRSTQIIYNVMFQYQKKNYNFYKKNNIIFSNKLIKIHKTYFVNIKMFVILLEFHIP